MFKNKTTIFYTFIAPILIFGLAVSFPGCKPDPFAKVELEFWGVFDDSDIYQPLITAFNQENKHITINYYKKNYETYEKDLLEAMASGRGPDIYMIHNTWALKYQDKLYSIPSDLMTLKGFQDSFVDVAYQDFVINNYIVALPLYVDTLALFYNKDIFNTAGIAQPPRTWDEFLDTVERITTKDSRDNIIRAGTALGTARNVNRSTDIISLLMLQSGTQMTDQNNTKATFDQSVGDFNPGQRTIQFYTDFANPLKAVYTWNTRMHYSIDAFYEGDLATMFNYSYNLPTIRAKSPYLNFGVAPMPQISIETSVNYANYWGLTTSINSKAVNEAWQFIVWLTNKENAQKYLEASKKPTARRDLVTWQRNDQDLGIFADQALTARSWYQVDNLAIEQHLADMIESVVLGTATIEEAINKAASQVSLLMK
ncbi:extracellular solute-binding protein [Patescibacteria group bacterium]|nr:extracellular solute-binding protein [Patescibacteria group bacterium]